MKPPATTRTHDLRLPATLGALLLAVMLFGCPLFDPGDTGSPADDSPPGDVSPPDGTPPVDEPVQVASIAGQLSVQPDTGSAGIVDEEPNDSVGQTQFASSLTAGDRVSVFGELSVESGDTIDAFEFTTSGPVEVAFNLSFLDDGVGPAEDLDLGVYDFEHFDCTLASPLPQQFANCFTGPDNPETGTFVADGPVVLVIHAYADQTDYQLDLTVRSLDDSDAISAKTGLQVAKTVVATSDTSSEPDGEFLITFADTLTSAQQDELLETAGYTLLDRSPSGLCRIALRSASSSDDKARVLARSVAGSDFLESQAGVRTLEPNVRRRIAAQPNDEFFDRQWHYTAINLPQAWDITTGNSEVIVAIVDTGILSGHPDLQGRTVSGYDFISDPSSANDGDGRDFDPEDPGDQFAGPGQSSFHGTHVAGTLAATTNNLIGVAGVTWQTRIMPLRALGIDGGTAFEVAEAIRYAAGLANVSGTVPNQPANIINLSLAGEPGEAASSAELDAIAAATEAGVLVVAAAGNSSSSLPTYPAAAPDALGVSAVDFQLALASYSNFGTTIDLAAPGGFTGTDLNGDGYGDGVLSTGGNDLSGSIAYEYIYSNGTSMATPHVAGVAALMLAANPNLTVAQLRDILESTALDLGMPGRDDQFGYGLVDAAAAVREAAELAGTLPTSQATLSLSNTNLNFGTELAEFSVQASSSSGTLSIESVQTTTDDGANWLSAETVGQAEDAASVCILITVDRTDLADATYHGTVTVQAAGLEPAHVAVTLIVGDSQLAIENIWVLAVDPATRNTVAQDVTRAANDFIYTIDQLPVGTYLVYAGTDRDDDGTICEIGDLCGALPSRLEPQSLTLTAGQAYTDANFGVARLILQQIAPASEANPPLRRLDH